MNHTLRIPSSFFIALPFDQFGTDIDFVEFIDNIVTDFTPLVIFLSTFIDLTDIDSLAKYTVAYITTLPIKNFNET